MEPNISHERFNKLQGHFPKVSISPILDLFRHRHLLKSARPDMDHDIGNELIKSIYTVQNQIDDQDTLFAKVGLFALYEVTNGKQSRVLGSRLYDTEFPSLAQKIREKFNESCALVRRDIEDGAITKKELSNFLRVMSYIPCAAHQIEFGFSAFDDLVNAVLGYSSDDMYLTKLEEHDGSDASIGYVSSTARAGMLVQRASEKYGFKRLYDMGCGRFRFGAFISSISDLSVTGYDHNAQHLEAANATIKRLRLDNCTAQYKNLLTDNLKLELEEGSAVYVYTPFYPEGMKKFTAALLKAIGKKEMYVIASDGANTYFEKPPFTVLKDHNSFKTLGIYKLN